MPSNGATNTWLTFRMADTRALASLRVEQEQDDPRSEDDLDQPEDEDDDAPGHLGAAGAGPGGATTVRPHRFLAPDSGFLGDDRAVDLIDSQCFSLAA